MSFFNKILGFIKRERVLSAAIAAILILPLVVFGASTFVKAGTKTICKYSHVIKDDTATKWVFRWTADSYKVTEKKTICGKHKKLEAMWEKAKEAKKKGDYRKASDILKTIRAADPTFHQVEEELAVVAGLLNESPPPAAPGGSQPPPGETPPNGEDPTYSGDLNGLFPSSLAGYKQVGNTNSGMNASRVYESDKAVHPNVSLLTIQLDSAGSESGANNYIDSEVKSYYAADSRSASIEGLTAYFGTDGRRLAILAYQIGGVVFTLEMETATGAPKDLYDDIVALAANVP